MKPYLTIHLPHSSGSKTLAPRKKKLKSDKSDSDFQTTHKPNSKTSSQTSTNDKSDSEFQTTHKRSSQRTPLKLKDTNKRSKTWVPSLGLEYHHRQTISESGWLSSDHINAAHKLLRQQFTISGLQDPGYAKNPSAFKVQGNGAIQIHHNGINHWLTSTCARGVVKVYDSLWKTDISPSVHLQLGAIYREKAKHGSLNVDICHVEHQTGSSDCGLYAVAYATNLAYGNDPSKISYSSDELRPHFIKCLENTKLTPFPRELELSRAERPSRVVIDIL